MSRFDYDGNGEGISWEMWERVVSNALGGKRGQQALAEMEDALVALPQPRLIHGHLAAHGAVCAVGALIAHKKAKAEGIDIAAVIDAMNTGITCWCGHGEDAHGAEVGCTRPHRFKEGERCGCKVYEVDPEDAVETAEAGQKVGLTFTVAWHLAWLNDDQFRSATPEDRYTQMLAWVRRAQGKETVAA